ncbi:hypothetical protein D3C73_1495670 [compost metagenome]
MVTVSRVAIDQRISVIVEAYDNREVIDVVISRNICDQIPRLQFTDRSVRMLGRWCNDLFVPTLLNESSIA